MGWRLALAVCICATSISGQDIDSELQQHFAAAQEAQKAGKFDDAAREYKTVLHLRTDIPEVYGNLGLVYYLEAKFEDSAAEFRKALSLKPDLRGADLFLGIDYVKLYRAPEAVPHLEKAVQQEPANKQARSWLCNALWDSGQTALAIDQLQKAVHDFPGDIGMLFLLGESYRKSAERETQNVLAGTPPTSPLYHQVYGDLYAMQGDRQKANAHYSRAQQLDPAWNRSMFRRPEVADDAYGRAVLHFSGGKYDVAESELRSLVAKDPKDLKSRYLLARTYANLSFATLNRLLAQDPNSFRAHQLQAQTYAYREESDKALAEYRIVEHERPELPGLHFEIGQLLWKKRENAQALAELKQELRFNPDHAEANADIGAILVAEHEPDQAIPYLKNALRLKPDLTMVHEQLGRAYYQRQEFGKAAEQLRQGLSGDHDGNVHYELAMADKQLGNVAEADAAFNESRKIKAERLAETEIRNEPQTTDQQYQLAVSLSQQGKYAEALTWFERLAQANPQSVASQFNLGLAYLNAKRPDDAIRVLQELTAQNSMNPDALGLLGRAYEAEGKLGDALNAYRLALNTDPKNPDRYLDYTQLLMDGNRFEEAAEVTMNGFNVVADPYPLYVRLGSVRLMEGKSGDARQAFQKAIQLHSEIPLGYVALAKSYLKEGVDAEAAKILSDARRKLPPDFALDYFYGLALLRLQRDSEAVGVLENAVHLGPAVPEAHYELGRAYFELGENNRARAEFERTIQLAPQDARAHYQLSRVYEKLGDREKAEQLAQATKRLKQTNLDEALEIQKRRLESFERE